MDESSAPVEQTEATPIFAIYRRGYDPEQVDRYIADQQRRLDEAVRRSSEAERRLAAAVGQLRELHRRVNVLESEERAPQQPQQQPSLDTLGERVQMILQEAWEGAYALRQAAERETSELRVQAAADAEEIVATSHRKAEAIEEEIERRRRGYLERVEQDRARAIAQMTYLADQRKLALKDLLQVKARIESTVAALAKGSSVIEVAEEEDGPADQAETAELRPEPAEEPRAIAPPLPHVRRTDDDGLPSTMPVHRLRLQDDEPRVDASELVSSHRMARTNTVNEESRAEARATARIRERPRRSIFDFEDAEPS